VAEARSILAVDLFHVDSVLGCRFYVLFFLEHDNRRVHGSADSSTNTPRSHKALAWFSALTGHPPRAPTHPVPATLLDREFGP
jgi:hypothetical protein